MEQNKHCAIYIMQSTSKAWKNRSWMSNLNRLCPMVFFLLLHLFVLLMLRSFVEDYLYIMYSSCIWCLNEPHWVLTQQPSRRFPWKGCYAILPQWPVTTVWLNILVKIIQEILNHLWVRHFLGFAVSLAWEWKVGCLYSRIRLLSARPFWPRALGHLDIMIRHI